LQDDRKRKDPIPVVWVADHEFMGDHGLQALTQRSLHREVRVTETLKKGTRVTGADRTKLAADLKKRYGAGESIRSLAASTGRSYGFIHRILTETGVALRGRGGATRGKKK
jgi:Helix-turn-helix domain